MKTFWDDCTRYIPTLRLNAGLGQYQEVVEAETLNDWCNIGITLIDRGKLPATGKQSRNALMGSCQTYRDHATALRTSKKPDPFRMMTTLKWSQGGYAGSCARNAPSFAVALNCDTGSKLLEGAGKGVRQAPHRPGREFGVLRLEIQPVDFRQQTSGRLELAVNAH
jgi:hypothetical protein